jgi:hypothetical protein
MCLKNCLGIFSWHTPFSLGSTLFFKIKMLIYIPTILLVLAFSSLHAAGHAVLLSPPARTGMAVGVGTKYYGNATAWLPDTTFPPCANSTAGPIAATFQAGSSIMVQWNVTIPHASPPGVFINIQFQPGGAFMPLAQGVNDTLGAYPVTLPAGQTSQNAVLQWMWQSMEDGGFYVGCSDIAVSAGLAGTGTTPTGAGMTTSIGAVGTMTPPSPTVPGIGASPQPGTSLTRGQIFVQPGVGLEIAL